MPALDAAKDGQRARSPDIGGCRDARHISRLSATQHHLSRTPFATACLLTNRHPQGLGAADPTLPFQPKAVSSASKAFSPMSSSQRVGSEALHPTRNALPRAAAQRQRKVVSAVGSHCEPSPPRSQWFKVKMVVHTTLEAHTNTSKPSWDVCSKSSSRCKNSRAARNQDCLSGNQESDMLRLLAKDTACEDTAGDQLEWRTNSSSWTPPSRSSAQGLWARCPAPRHTIPTRFRRRNRVDEGLPKPEFLQR